MDINHLSYRCISCSRMTDEEINATAKLFSEHYGIWSQKGINPGKNVKLSSTRIRQDYVEKPDRYVAMVFDGQRLVGHAFYMIRFTNANKKIIWILQLVVDKEYRHNKIGAKIMFSIWSLSDCYAWGLYTSNPYTIHSLEEATMRRIKLPSISEHINDLKEVAYDLFSNTYWIDNYKNGIVNTEFFVDHSIILDRITSIYNDKNRTFPFDSDLPEGYEWLAFVFAEQKLKPNKDQIDTMLKFSDEIMRTAYSRMHLENQKWAKHPDEEVEFIRKQFTNRTNRILDAGCGNGAILEALSKYNYELYGIDINKNKHIDEIIKNKPTVHFYQKDIRYPLEIGKFDAIISLYDVIGSYPDVDNNKLILRQFYKQLRHKGKLVISVMNFDLTYTNCLKHRNVVNDIHKNLGKLLHLPGSQTMQDNGEVFDGKYIVADASTGNCYRKEQFFDDDYLPSEYVIIDKRYTKNEITNLLIDCGFIIEQCYCVRAGHFNEPLKENNEHAKEILIVARRNLAINVYYKQLASKINLIARKLKDM